MIKRAFDIAASSLGLIFLFPLLLTIALVIKAQDNGPALFVQTRIGKDFTPFKLYKFRTMTDSDNIASAPITVKGDIRITKSGAILRRLKLDELPQLLNVLKGDMSIVGPRPEAPQFVAMFRDDYRDILRVKPGITDYAALAFRNEEEILAQYEQPEEAYVNIILPKKIELYRKYIDEMSLLRDLEIILKTLLAVFISNKNSKGELHSNS